MCRVGQGDKLTPVGDAPRKESMKQKINGEPTNLGELYQWMTLRDSPQAAG